MPSRSSAAQTTASRTAWPSPATRRSWTRERARSPRADPRSSPAGRHAPVDDRDVVRDLLDLVEEVRREEDGHAVLDEPADHLAELVNPGRVEPVRGLVQDQELGIGKQARGRREPLAHAEGVALHAIVRPVGQSDAVEHLSIRACASPARCGDRQVLGRSGTGGSVAPPRSRRRARVPLASPRDRRAQKTHRACTRPREPEQQPNERRLPGAVRPEEPERAATGNCEVEIRERRALSNRFVRPWTSMA